MRNFSVDMRIIFLGGIVRLDFASIPRHQRNCSLELFPPKRIINHNKFGRMMQCLLGRRFYEFHCFGRLAHTSSKSTIKKHPQTTRLSITKQTAEHFFWADKEKNFHATSFFGLFFFLPSVSAAFDFWAQTDGGEKSFRQVRIYQHTVSFVVAPNPRMCIPESSTRPAYCRFRRWSVSRSMCTTRKKKKKCFSSWERKFFEYVEYYFFSLSIHVSLHRHHHRRHPNGYDRNSNNNRSLMHTSRGGKSTKVKSWKKSRTRKMFLNRIQTCLQLTHWHASYYSHFEWESKEHKPAFIFSSSASTRRDEMRWLCERCRGGHYLINRLASDVGQ